MVARRGAKGAGQRPELHSAERRGQAVLSADECVAYFHREGWAERILAPGSVRGSVHAPAGAARPAAQAAEAERPAAQCATEPTSSTSSAYPQRGRTRTQPPRDGSARAR